MTTQNRERRERRDKMIGVVVTAEEHERIRVLAFEAHQSMGAYLRDLALPPTPKRRATK